MPKDYTAIRGQFGKTPKFGEVEITKDLFLVAETAEQGGKIVAIVPGEQESEACRKFGLRPENVIRLKVITCLIC